MRPVDGPASDQGERRAVAPERDPRRNRERAGGAAQERDVEAVPGLEALAEAFLSLRTSDEVQRFLRDLCTLPELEALAHRWRTVRFLEQGMPYVEIAGRVPTSTATVTRVAQWLRHGTGGYRTALDRLAGREP